MLRLVNVVILTRIFSLTLPRFASNLESGNFSRIDNQFRELYDTLLEKTFCHYFQKYNMNIINFCYFFLYYPSVFDTGSETE